MANQATHTGVLALALLLPAAVSGCHSKYTKAVSAYSKASDASVEALSSAPSAVAQLCHRHAQAKFLQTHLPAASALPAEKVRWRDWYETDKATETSALTWKRYCDEIAESGKGFSAAVDLLSAYAEALAKLADEDGYDGGNVEGLVEGVGAVANAPKETAVGKTIKKIAAPTAGLGKLLLGAYRGGKIKQYSAAADPSVQAILSGLDDYVKAAEELLSETEKYHRDALARVETLGDLYKDPVDLAKITQFFQFAVALGDQTREARATLAGYRDVIAGLKRAQVRLTHAADDDSPPVGQR